MEIPKRQAPVFTSKDVARIAEYIRKYYMAEVVDRMYASWVLDNSEVDLDFGRENPLELHTSEDGPI